MQITEYKEKLIADILKLCEKYNLDTDAVFKRKGKRYFICACNLYLLDDAKKDTDEYYTFIGRLSDSGNDTYPDASEMNKICKICEYTLQLIEILENNQI